MKLFIVLCLVAAVAADFGDFQKKHGRKYKNAEQALKAEAHFKRNMKKFEEHNAKFQAGEVSFTIGENQFSDKNHTEVIAAICKTVAPKDMRALPAVQLPSTFPAGAASKDYTSWMQPVVDQGDCGSCWAFATVAQLESVYKRNSPVYNYVMSPQYLVDCSTASPNTGCDGGWPSVAMTKILSSGMPLGTTYPYKGVQATCSSAASVFVSPKLPTQVNSYNLNGNEVQLKNIVSQDGPVVVAIYATDLFLAYTSGRFSDSTCPTDCSVNHAVVVVGYGTDSSGDYWLVRNSWGVSWGVGGYVKMARNSGNNCSIACNAMYLKK